MKFSISKADRQITSLARKIGYIPQKSNDWNEFAFTRPMMGGEFPRFHLYVKETGEEFIFNLHLDQQQAKYGRHTAHGGEYEGGSVEAEAERIKTILINSLVKAPQAGNGKEIKREEGGKDSLTSLFRKMFGN